MAEAGGINIHAGTAVDGRDRRRLERLRRYLARPPLCAERLELQDDGKVRYSFRAPWKDGTRAVVLTRPGPLLTAKPYADHDSEARTFTEGWFILQD